MFESQNAYVIKCNQRDNRYLGFNNNINKKDPNRDLVYVRQMIRKQGLHWRDFAVITGDMETYADYAERIFGNYGIPCFTDRKKSLFMNPFVEFIRASVDMLVEKGTKGLRKK